MRRWILLISLLLFLSALALVGFGNWVLRSPSGTDWLLKVVSGAAEVQISTGQVEGRLADDLIIKELIVDWQGGQLLIERIHLGWDPFSILQGRLNIHTLDIGQMVMRSTDSPDSPQTLAAKEDAESFTAADLSFLPGWLTVKVESLHLQGFAYQNGEDIAVIADELSGSYIWSQWQISAPKFSYLSPYVHLRGSFAYDLQQPHLDMNAAVHLPEALANPQLFQDIAVPVEFPGQIAFDGDWNDFSGPVSFGTVADVADNLWLAADARGSWQGIRFDNLRGWYLNGSLTGDLDLAWTDSYRMHGNLTGTGMDPGVLIEDLNGRAQLDVSGDLLISYDDQPLQANLTALIHEGQLRGHAVGGNLAAQWQGGGLYEINLDLSGDEARVVAHGKPSERLELDLAVADLRAFYPDLAGQLKASGWLKWSDDYLTGEVDGTGVDIVWQESSLASLSFQGRHLARQAPLQLELDGQGLQHAGVRVDHLQAGVNGSLQSHDVRLLVTDLNAELEAQLTGHYQDDTWRGEVASFSGQASTLGAWTLKAPASIMWQSQSLSLERFSLASSRDEHVTLEVFQWLAPTTSRVALTWDKLSHDWLAYLKLPLEVSGRSSGKLLLEMIADQPLSLETQLTATVDIEDELGKVTIPSLAANVSWLQDGLSLNLNAESARGEVLVAKGHSSEPPNWKWPPEELFLDLRWQKVALARLSQFRQDLDVQGSSDGMAQIEILAGQLLRANASLTADGVMQHNSKPVGFHSLLAELNWEEKGFYCDAQLKGVRDGKLSLNLTSSASPHLSWPKSGRMEMKIDDLDLQSLNPLLPSGASFDGVINGHSSGYWQEDGQVFMEGQAGLSAGDLVWHSREGQVDITVQKADLEWRWQDEQLKGSLALLMASEGELRGRWQLPIPAHWPVSLDANGALQAELHSEMRATGLLVAFAPGLIQDLKGQIKSDLHVAGSWQSPLFSGQMSVSDASAYLPISGVTLEDLNLRVVLQGDQLKIEEFTLISGPGSMRVAGGVDFDQWRLARYQLTIKGERLQVYNFPELQILCSPDLTLAGDTESLQLRGNLLIPEMSLLGTTTAPEFSPSTDVVISGSDTKDHRDLPINTDVLVAVKLGDQVRVKTAGVETLLRGGGTVTLDEQQHLVVRGEITLSEGIYKAYGANLVIKQGVLKYTGGPVENPRLSILATREVGTVQAGVQITGTAEAPVVTLYSQPAMPERDIMGYIFMGRPMKAGQEGSDALMIGAGALMPVYGGTFSDLGISEIDVQGLFDGSGGVSVRKRLTEKLEIESTLGIESGIDLYYLFKFD